MRFGVVGMGDEERRVKGLVKTRIKAVVEDLIRAKYMCTRSGKDPCCVCSQFKDLKVFLFTTFVCCV